MSATATQTQSSAERYHQIRAEQSHHLDMAERHGENTQVGRAHLAEFDRLQAEKESLHRDAAARGNPNPVHTAFHEAGHALAHWYYGDRACTATIVPNATSNGHVMPGRKLSCFEEAVTLWAGQEAVIYSPNPEQKWRGVDGDQEKIAVALAQYPSLIPDAKQKAIQILANNSLALRALAGALLEKQTMTAPDIAAVLGQYVIA